MTDYHRHSETVCFYGCLGYPPVVVIDPEDRVQVERLRDLYDAALRDQAEGPPLFPSSKGEQGNALQAALRSLITPPKPPEPTEFAALAVERDGTVWHRVRDAEADGHRFPWATADSAATWDRLDIVAVYPAPKPEVTA